MCVLSPNQHTYRTNSFHVLFQLKINSPFMTPTPHNHTQRAATAASLNCAHSANRMGHSFASVSIIQQTPRRPVLRSKLNEEHLTQMFSPMMRDSLSHPEFVSFSTGRTPHQSGESFPLNLAENGQSEFSTEHPQVVSHHGKARSRSRGESFQIRHRNCEHRVETSEFNSMNLRTKQAGRHELRKTCHEKRNACQCSPTGGEPHCHPRGWSSGRALRRTEQQRELRRQYL